MRSQGGRKEGRFACQTEEPKPRGVWSRSHNGVKLSVKIISSRLAWRPEPGEHRANSFAGFRWRAQRWEPQNERDDPYVAIPAGIFVAFELCRVVFPVVLRFCSSRRLSLGISVVVGQYYTPVAQPESDILDPRHRAKWNHAGDGRVTNDAGQG